jgi:hypothetical protein
VMDLPIEGIKGGRTVALDIPWVDDDNLIRDFGMQVLRTGRYPSGRLRQHYKLQNDNTRQFILGAHPGKLIQYISPTAHGVNGEQANDFYRVEARHLELTLPGEIPKASLTLMPAYQYRNLAAIAWDDFNRPDATGALGTTPTNKTWTNDSSWNIVSNKAVPNTGGAGICFFDLGKADMVIEIDLANMNANTTGAGVSYRVNSAGTIYWSAFADYANSLIKLQLNDGINSGIKAQAAWTPAATGAIRVVVQGTRHRIWFNRKLVIDHTLSNANTNSQTRCGMVHGGSGSNHATFDNFYAQSLIA